MNRYYRDTVVHGVLVFADSLIAWLGMYLIGVVFLDSVRAPISGTEVSDVGLKHLQGLNKLRKLDLSRTDVTNVGVKTLRKALSKCIIYHVDDN